MPQCDCWAHRNAQPRSSRRPTAPVPEPQDATVLDPPESAAGVPDEPDGEAP